MNNVYFEAMEYHNLERQAKMEKHRDGFDKWTEESMDTYEYIQKLVNKGLPLGKEELEFLMRNTAENIYKKAETAEYEFFAHHFDRVDRQQKELQESARKNRVIDEYSTALKTIADADVPILFGAKDQLERVKRDAHEALHRGQKYV